MLKRYELKEAQWPTDQASAARQSRRPGQDRRGLPGFRQRLFVGFTQRGLLVPSSSRALRQLSKAPTRSALLAGPRRAFGRRFSRSWRPTRATRVPHDRHEHRVRAHQSRQPREKGEPKREASLGGSRGGLCTKIHMLTDAFWAVHCASLLARVMSSTTALSGESPARRL